MRRVASPPPDAAESPRPPTTSALWRAAHVAARRFGIHPPRFVRVMKALVRAESALLGRGVAPARGVSAVAVLSAVLEHRPVVQSTPSPCQRMARVDPSRPPPVWKPLPPDTVGRHTLNPAALRGAFDTARPRDPPPPAPRPGPSPATPAVRAFVADSLSLGLVDEVDPLANPPTGHLSIIPKNAEKSRAIFDCRWLNARQSHLPRRFRLPAFENVKPLLCRGPCWFVVADIANFYPSLRLPASGAPPFVFHVSFPPGVRAFRFNHLPFGWDASPLLAQEASRAFSLPAAAPGSRIFDLLHPGWRVAHAPCVDLPRARCGLRPPPHQDAGTRDPV